MSPNRTHGTAQPALALHGQRRVAVPCLRLPPAPLMGAALRLSAAVLAMRSHRSNQSLVGGTSRGATGADDVLFWRVQFIVDAGIYLHLGLGPKGFGLHGSRPQRGPVRKLGTNPRQHRGRLPPMPNAAARGKFHGPLLLDYHEARVGITGLRMRDARMPISPHLSFAYDEFSATSPALTPKAGGWHLHGCHRRRRGSVLGWVPGVGAERHRRRTIFTSKGPRKHRLSGVLPTVTPSTAWGSASSIRP